MGTRLTAPQNISPHILYFVLCETYSKGCLLVCLFLFFFVMCDVNKILMDLDCDHFNTSKQILKNLV